MLSQQRHVAFPCERGLPAELIMGRSHRLCPLVWRCITVCDSPGHFWLLSAARLSKKLLYTF